MDKVLTPKEIERISKALGDPYRLKIMELIANEQNCLQCVAVVEKIDLAQSTISHHLKQLVDADLLIAEKDGRNVRYQVNKLIFKAYIAYLNRFKD